MGTHKRQDRPHPPSDMQPLWDWLKGQSCPVCLEALDGENGSGIVIERGGLARHLQCTRAPGQADGPIRRPKP